MDIGEIVREVEVLPLQEPAQVPIEPPEREATPVREPAER